MKLTLSIPVSVLFLAGCCNGHQHNYVKDNIGRIFEIVEIDSCEYIYNPNSYQLVHKCNCKYCEQRRKEEQK